MYVRTHMVKSFSIDDIMMIAALVRATFEIQSHVLQGKQLTLNLQLFLFGGGIVAQIYSGTHGALGRHQDSDSVTDEDILVYGKMRFVQGVLMTITSICLLKFSIGLSLLRLDANRWYRRTLWVLIGKFGPPCKKNPRLIRNSFRHPVFIFCYMVESWVSLLAFCNPMKAAWDMKAAKTARCFSTPLVNAFATMNTAFNIFTDICFATIPIPMLWALQRSLRVRIYLIAIFNLGYMYVRPIVK